MPTVDKSKYQKPASGGQGEKVTVPGVYSVQVKHATTKVREDGAEEWMLLCEVVGGVESKGKIIFENLYWTERGTARCLDVIEALGVEVPDKGDKAYTPDMLVGKTANVELIASGKEAYPVKSKYDGWSRDYPF